MKTRFEQMMDGLGEVEAFLSGERRGFKAHVPEKVDVKSIRNKLGMTHKEYDSLGSQMQAYDENSSLSRTTRK